MLGRIQETAVEKQLAVVKKDVVMEPLKQSLQEDLVRPSYVLAIKHSTLVKSVQYITSRNLELTPTERCCA